MEFDFKSEVIAALRSPDGKNALVDAMRTVLAESLTATNAMNTKCVRVDGLGEIIGSPSKCATKARIARDAALAALAFRQGRTRVWRISEVEELMRRRREETVR